MDTRPHRGYLSFLQRETWDHVCRAWASIGALTRAGRRDGAPASPAISRLRRWCSWADLGPVSSRPDRGRGMLLGFQATGAHHFLYSCPSLSETGFLGLTNSWPCFLVWSLGSPFLLLDESPELFCKLTSRLPPRLRGPDQDPCSLFCPPPSPRQLTPGPFPGSWFLCLCHSHSGSW